MVERKYSDVCVICGKTYGEHRWLSHHCPESGKMNLEGTKVLEPYVWLNTKFKLKRRNNMSWYKTLEPHSKAHLAVWVNKWEFHANEIKMEPTRVITLEEMVAESQFETAKNAALRIAEALPGPYIGITVGGHANGVGWQPKPGVASECITVTVTQFAEDYMQQQLKQVESAKTAAKVMVPPPTITDTGS